MMSKEGGRAELECAYDKHLKMRDITEFSMSRRSGEPETGSGRIGGEYEMHQRL